MHFHFRFRNGICVVKIIYKFIKPFPLFQEKKMMTEQRDTKESKARNLKGTGEVTGGL